MFPQKYLKLQGWNQENGNQCCLPSFKISLNNKLFHISLNSLGFYLYLEYLLNFLLVVYSTMYGKIFLIYGDPGKCIELMHFYSCQSSPLKTPRRIFEKSLSRKMKGVGKTMICFMKIQSKNMKITLYFV